ncbi:LLM class flavin-dependent oxidoreductase [Streptomyces violens]|uniref:LLM class flavin-dependent oxidoreductase n=1 Tax=Streptomyces violens TaxID=66377 RepID=UPI0004BF730C|nr:LLM class flavin-dependent oxidoreductase [Streptomyces violens]
MNIPRIGITLPSIGAPGDVLPDVAQAARRAEEAGLDGVWAGDHLTLGEAPALDSGLVLATAAAATRTLGIGWSVYLPSLRSVSWAGRQIGTLQYLAGDGRLDLGIGVGGGGAEWHAAGTTDADRGHRTDAFLRLLPKLLGGSPTPLPDVPGTPECVLAPAVPVPPVWIGGFATAALRRTVRYGTGWLGALRTPDAFRATGDRLRELAAEEKRPAPRLATMIHGALAPRGATDGLRDRYATTLAASYGMDHGTARTLAVTGDPEQVAEQLTDFVRAGAESLVFTTPVPDWHRCADLLGEARQLVLREIS